MSPRTIFLLDASGALLSTLLLGAVLPAFPETFGVPADTLYWLAGLAALFAVYSFTCYLRLPTNWPPYLRAIAIVNLLYCCLTAGLVFVREEITTLGVVYFVGEILIVAALATYELRRASADVKEK